MQISILTRKMTGNGMNQNPVNLQCAAFDLKSKMLWSKSILKRLLRLTVIFMVIAINKGDVMNLEQLTNVVKQLDATIKADQVEKSQLKSHITHLETELASVKNTSLTNEQETKNTLAIMETELASVKNTSLTNEQETKNTLAIRDRFEMFFKTSTSCSKIARLGNIESGTYNIDTDADGNEAPYEVRFFLLLLNLLHLRIFFSSTKFASFHFKFFHPFIGFL